MEVPSPKSRCWGHTGSQHAGMQPQGGGGHRGAGSPRNSLGSVLSWPQHPPWLETSTALLPSGHSRQLPVPAAKGGMLLAAASPPPISPNDPPLHPSWVSALFYLPTRSQKFTGKSWERAWGANQSLRALLSPSASLTGQGSGGVPGPSPRTPGRNQPQNVAPHRSLLPAMAAPGSPRVPGRAMPRPALPDTGKKKQHQARRRLPEFARKGLNNPR